MTAAAAETTVHPVVVLHAGRLIQGQLIYRTADPLAVSLRVLQSQSQSMEWTFGIDLLAAGYNRSDVLLGPGDISVRRYGTNVVVVLRNTRRDQEVMILLQAQQVLKFLRAVNPVALDFDSELDELLRGSSE